jgi:3-dehydroquinate dehydratase/shikimate dehydrogenase
MKQARWVELRLDYLRSTKEMSQLLSRMNSFKPGRHSLIFTLRRREAGGRFKGTMRSQLHWLKRAALLGQWLDLEIETLRREGTPVVRDLKRAGARVIVSYHNFKRTPVNLSEVAKHLLAAEGNLIKIATQANSMSDAVRLLGLQHDLAQKGHRSVILGMGACGSSTRILGPSRGAEFTYASLSRGRESAPGQWTALELKNTFRINSINSQTGIYGLLGCPLSHSLSPALYNSAFAHLRMNAVYLPFETRDLMDFPAWTKRLKVKGLSVTLPHKAEVMQFVSKEDPAARRVGVVNTLRQRRGRWLGYNTDVRGVEKPLRELGLDLKKKEVLLLGAGGVAQTVAAVLHQAGAKVLIYNRTRPAARRLARRFGHGVVQRTQLRNRHFALIINATSVGMWPAANKVPINLDRMRADVVFDLVYNPADTRLLQEARRRKMRTLSGMKMFISQAEAQFRILTGKRLPTAVWSRVKGTDPP